MLATGPGSASSHREAPLISNDPQGDNTDLYAFVSPDSSDKTTFVANWTPFSEPAGGPNFYPFAVNTRHNIHIDNDGDARADITYRWTFETDDARGTDTFLYANGDVTTLDDPNLLFRQTYTLQRIADGQVTTLIDDAPVAPSNVGAATMPDYAALRDEAVVPVGDGLSFAGQADDPFFLDLRIFDLLYGGDLSETGDDTLAGFNVNTIALQVPSAELMSRGDPVIGVWTTTQRRSLHVQGTGASRGAFVQISRLGNPLVNEVVVPAGLKDAFNALPPRKDRTVQPVVDRVNDPEVPKLIEAIYGIEAPATPRDDLFAIFLTGLDGLNKPGATVTPAEMLRLNTSVQPSAEPNRLGVLAGDTSGFPNGRRLTDDVVDIEIQALEGAARTGEIVEALAAGDGVDENDVAFGPSFPYVGLPHSGSGVDSPDGGVDAGGGGTAPDRRAAASSEGGAVPAPAVAAGVLGLVFAGLGVTTAVRGRRRARA